jgi:hypothetical protein
MVKELVKEFFSLDIIKEAKIQLHLKKNIIKPNILKPNVEQFLSIFELIVIENLTFKSNFITNLLKNEIKKITIKVVFNKNIEQLRNYRKITITEKFQKTITEVAYINVIDLNKINITIHTFSISGIELTFSTLLMYLKEIIRG